MTEYINRDEVLSMSYCTNKPTWDNSHLDPKSVVDVEDIESLPAADVVSQEVFDQVKWERDTALATLEEHGIGLAQKVEVVHGHWKKWWSDDYLTYFHRCSVCGEEALTKEETYHDEVLSKYCPGCGARMDGIREV